MPAITLGYSQIEQQIRVIRRRRNGFIVQHAIYLCGGVIILAIALLVVLAIRSERLAFTFAFWAAIGAIVASFATAVLIVWRRWITESGTPRWVDRVAQLDDRLSTLVAHWAPSESPPLGGGEVKRGNRLLPALISQLFALRYRWEPATLVPRRVPRSLYFFLAATVALIAASFIERPPATPQRFPQNAIIPAHGNGPDDGTGLRIARMEANGTAGSNEHPLDGDVGDADLKGAKGLPRGHGSNGRSGTDGSNQGMPVTKGSSGKQHARDDAGSQPDDRGAAQALPGRVQEMIRHALHQPSTDEMHRAREAGDAQRRRQAKNDPAHDREGQPRSQDESGAQMAQSSRDEAHRSQTSMTPREQPESTAGGRGTNGSGGGGQGTNGIYGRGAPTAGQESGAGKTFQLKLVLQGRSPSTTMEPQKPGHGNDGDLGVPADYEARDLPLNPRQRTDEPLVRSEIPPEHEGMIKRIFSRAE